MELTDRPLEAFGQTLIDTAIPSDLRRKTPLVREMVTALSAHACLAAADTARAELVLDEAMTNAIVHGNGRDPAKQVRVRLFADGGRWGAIIEDEGTGFDPADVLEKLNGESLLRDGGRGLLLMDEYLDECTYADGGRAVLLVGSHAAAGEGGGARPEAADATGAEPAPVVSVVTEGEVTIAHILQDSLFGDNSEAVLERLTEAVGASPTLIVDMHRVGYISSMGLAVVAQTYKQMRARGGVVILAGAQSAVREFLAKSRLADFFRFAPDLHAARQLAGRIAQ